MYMYVILIGYFMENIQGRTAIHPLPMKTNTDGSVWAKLGQRHYNWNSVNQFEEAQFVPFLSQEHQFALKDIDILDWYVESDLLFKWKADNSMNPSTANVWYPGENRESSMQVM